MTTCPLCLTAFENLTKLAVHLLEFHGLPVSEVRLVILTILITDSAVPTAEPPTVIETRTRSRSMNRLRLTLFLGLVCLIAAGCATTTGDANLVRLTSNPEQVKGCKFLGEVRGSGAWANPFNSVEMSGENAMRKHAAQLGATHVLLTYANGVPGTRAVAAGEAYLCSTSAR